MILYLKCITSVKENWYCKMIRIQKEVEPQILTDNKAQWTADLMALVRKYGSYDNIPSKIKNAAIVHYKHIDVANTLKGSQAKAKCVYCESYVDVTCYANIEHYHPKSIYPEQTFQWDNMYMGCTLCNTPKNAFDTGNEPFIHPENEDPEDFLTFDDMMYVPKYFNGTAYQKAWNVIDKCELQRLPLIQAHALILVSFMKSRLALIERIGKYNTHVDERTKIKDALAIYKTMIGLKNEAADDAQYAGFMRYLLRKSPEIRNAMMIVNQHKTDFGLVNDFDWGFKFC